MLRVPPCRDNRNPALGRPGGVGPGPLGLVVTYDCLWLHRRQRSSTVRAPGLLILNGTIYHASTARAPRVRSKRGHHAAKGSSLGKIMSPLLAQWSPPDAASATRRNDGSLRSRWRYRPELSAVPGIRSCGSRRYRRFMSVLVVPYSDFWPALFAAEADRLTATLAAWLVGNVEHIGSTAVPGLAAKPILDMLAPIQDLNVARSAIPALAELGYQHADHRQHEALWFYKQWGDDYNSRTHQLHLTRPDSALWRERLTFRDALRVDPSLMIEYQDLKQTLASGTFDLTDYTAGKRDFVVRVLRSKGVDLG